MAVVAGRAVTGELQARRVGRDEVVFVAAAGAPASRARRVRPADLREESWVLREEGSDTRRLADAWFRRHHLTPARVIALHGPDAVRRGVLAKLGMALISRAVVDEDVRAGRLSMVRIDPAVPPREIWLVDHPHKHHGAACRAMLQLLGL
jgi:DNA-binding transcriptional LysR family regulator